MHCIPDLKEPNMMRGIMAFAYLTTAAVLAIAAVVNYHAPNPIQPFLLAVASIGFSALTILTARRALQLRGRS